MSPWFSPPLANARWKFFAEQLLAISKVLRGAVPACRCPPAPQATYFEGIRVDGNDVLAVLAATRYAMEKIRAGEGPVLT